jgi:hypothetical protein
VRNIFTFPVPLCGIFFGGKGDGGGESEALGSFFFKKGYFVRNIFTTPVPLLGRFLGGGGWGGGEEAP